MITQEQADALKTALIEVCDKHLANGGVIMAGSFAGIMVGDAQRMCPIGCLSGGSNYFVKACEILGGTEDEFRDDIWDFVHAFDGELPTWTRDINSHLAVLGRELRAKYLNK
jgi:hypothetical protein